MQSHEKNTMEFTLEKHKGTQFCELIKNSITETNKYSIKQTVFSDGLESLRTCRDHLVTAYAALEPQMLAEEKQHSDFKIPTTLYHNWKNSNSEVDALKVKLEKMRETFENTKDALTRRKNMISEANNKKTDDLLISGTQKIIKSNNDLNKLEISKKELLFKHEEIQKKIDAKCCSCIPRCVKQETDELDSNSKAIKDIEIKIQVLLANENKLTMLDPGKNLDSLSPYAEIDNQIETATKNYLTERDKVEADLDAAKLNQATAIGFINTKKKSYYCIISNETMSNCLRVYAYFDQLREELEKILATKYAQLNGQLPPNEPLVLLKEKLNSFHSEIASLINLLWCPYSSDKTANAIFQQFIALPKADQEAFLKNKDNGVVSKKLISKQKGTRLAELYHDTTQFSYQTLFSLDRNDSKGSKESPTLANTASTNLTSGV